MTSMPGMGRAALGVVLCLAAAACTTTDIWWTKPGFNEAQFNRDWLNCKMLVSALGEGNWGAGSQDDPNMQSCMKGKGYTIERMRTRPLPLV